MPKLIRAMTQEIVLKLWSLFNVAEANCFILNVLAKTVDDGFYDDLHTKSPTRKINVRISYLNISE